MSRIGPPTTPGPNKVILRAHKRRLTRLIESFEAANPERRLRVAGKLGQILARSARWRDATHAGLALAIQHANGHDSHASLVARYKAAALVAARRLAR